MHEHPQAPADGAAGRQAPPPERMSRVDTAWLRMDNDVNLMMIVGVWLLTPAVTHEQLRERVRAKLLQYDRFRQIARHDPVGAVWVEDTAFDIDRHVTAGPLEREPGESDRQALQRLVGELANTALDPAHPLWHFHLVHGYEGGSALVARVHHCIGDGIALISVMMGITDGGADPPRRRRKLHAEHGAAAGEYEWLTDAVIRPLTDITLKAIGNAEHGLSRSLEMLSHPQQPLLGSMAMARGGLQVLQDVAALAAMPDDSPTLLKGKPMGRKVVAWSEPMPLDEVKAVGRGLGCTVNDVLLACVAGAIGGWLQSQGQDPTGREIRAMVPVNLRPLQDAWKLGNRFGLAPLMLPVGIANPVQRVYAVRERMAELKGSYQPLLAFAVLSLSGLFVKPVQDAILGLFAKKATAVMTNVPGPAQPLRFCGSTLRQTLFWVPASGDIGVGVSILSYAGGVQFGLVTDYKLCPEPQAVVERFQPEFEKLLLLTLMLPWGQDEATEATEAAEPARGPA